MPRGERGFITLWVLGLTVAVLFLGGLGVDLWRAIAVRREISAMADAAATAGANGLNESALRGGRLELDDDRVRRLAANELAEYPAAARARRRGGDDERRAGDGGVARARRLLAARHLHARRSVRRAGERDRGAEGAAVGEL